MNEVNRTEPKAPVKAVGEAVETIEIVVEEFDSENAVPDSTVFLRCSTTTCTTC